MNIWKYVERAIDSYMRWSEWNAWVGAEGKPVMLIKWLVDLERPKLVIDLHKMVSADYPAAYHTHPYNAIRIPLWGGYIEELHDGTQHVIWPGRVGIVRHDYAHRVHCMLFARASYSLWIRRASWAPIETPGEGWKTAPKVGYHKGPPPLHCKHTMREKGKLRMPLRYGSAETQICIRCGAWRTMHHVPGQWRVGPLADAVRIANEEQEEL